MEERPMGSRRRSSSHTSAANLFGAPSMPSLVDLQGPRPSRIPILPNVNPFSDLRHPGGPISLGQAGVTLFSPPTGSLRQSKGGSAYPPPSLGPFQSAGQNEKPVVTGFVRWLNELPVDGESRAPVGTAAERAHWFDGLLNTPDAPAENERQAETIEELIKIRAFHGDKLRRHSLGTALGFRTKGGVSMNQPAIIVFVARKVHEQWLTQSQKLPSRLRDPAGVWCDVDVAEFSYHNSTGTLAPQPVHSELVEGLRGNFPRIGPGSQIASEEMYGTLGVVVQSKIEGRDLGFLTNHHVAVNLDQPRQLMYHPLPPSHGPGLYLGAVDRACSFASDFVWYGLFSSCRPETFVRVDGAFIPFRSGLNMGEVTTEIQGYGPIGPPYRIDLKSKISNIVGRKVAKVGRSSGLTKGTIMGYSVEYHDDKGNSFVTDFLILGDNGEPFDMEGDSGSAILLLPRDRGFASEADKTGSARNLQTDADQARRPEDPSTSLGLKESVAREGSLEGDTMHMSFETLGRGGVEIEASGEGQRKDGQVQGEVEGGRPEMDKGMGGGGVGEIARPVGLIWGGTANKGRLKLSHGRQPENWTSGVDLARLLDMLQLEAVTSTEELSLAQDEVRLQQERQREVGEKSEEDSPLLQMRPFDLNLDIGGPSSLPADAAGDEFTHAQQGWRHGAQGLAGAGREQEARFKAHAVASVGGTAPRVYREDQGGSGGARNRSKDDQVRRRREADAAESDEVATETVAGELGEEPATKRSRQ